ncbi:MAG: DUF4830 domain-containing protein [Ruminococcaceae bacterium]|nr:DUF4830 domain-containing protein [Oscillospiraceae bacterium]MBQ9692860.1 DUF4830 domain-containing protein [Clostridia bacterium]
MFIYTVKASTIRFIATLMVAVAIITVLAVFMPAYETVAVFADDGTVIYTNAKTNEGRIEFLRKFGWEVESDPQSETDVTIPTEFDAVFVGYNDLQKLQGLDLSRYKRKSVTRYTYVVTNYPDYDGTVYANLLIYRGRIIGGDICTEASDGFIHGFSKNVHL